MLGKAGWSLSSLLLDGRRRIDIVRRFRGDLPDWLACAADPPVREVDGASAIDGLVGGIVTRAGPPTDAAEDPADQDVLARLNLRPVFVGIERDLIDAAIEGEDSA